MVTLRTAGIEQEGVTVALETAEIQWGHVRVPFRDRGYKVGRYDGDFGTAGTKWGDEMVALWTVGMQPLSMWM